MPTYEYKCPDCGERFERYQSIMAGPVRKCPACGRRRLKRLIGAGGGFIFKGSGFYATDYRSESYTKAAKAEKDAASPPKAESAPKTETPPKKDKKADTAASK